MSRRPTRSDRGGLLFCEYFMAKRPQFKKSVFINCPFDDKYVPFFQATIFTLMILDFTPRSAFEIDDGGVRLEKIIKIMGECKYGIHDISRTELDEENGLPRFNMPFELGLDLGSKKFGEARNLKSKIHLILAKDKHGFRPYISDISGQDIKGHRDDPENIIPIIRDWLRTSSDHIQAASFIKREYKLFLTQIERICEELNLDHDGHGFIDFVHIVKTWLDQRRMAT